MGSLLAGKAVEELKGLCRHVIGWWETEQRAQRTSLLEPQPERPHGQAKLRLVFINGCDELL